ncbi:MAG: hypothetical protein JO267_08490 [Alphaproteobacteria bacterium]|nr:hypothetical protein [Alphaproteobacteria bacterium]
MNLIEVAIYALVLSGPAPGLCRLGDDAVVRCSNGLSAEMLSATQARFSNGVIARHRGDEFPVFSNGITSHLGSAGWLSFSNGVAVRRRPDGRYDFDDGVSCRAALPDLVNCTRAQP